MNWRQRLGLACCVVCLHTSATAATFEEVKTAHRPSDTLILDRQGEILHRLRTDKQIRRGPWVELTQISPALRTALVLSEDKRFYEHSGVDWQAVTAAAWANLWNTRTRGASTLTMQLAGLLDEDLRRGSDGRTVVQKLGQTLSAQSLERQWRKDQILEAYLNLVPFRGELVGIEALSQTLFGKAAHGLNHLEAAMAVALVRAPNAKERQVAQRSCQVLKSLEPKPDCETVSLFVSAALARRDYAADEGIAPHVARQVAKQRAQSRTIITTLSVPLQRFAVQTLHTHLRELSGRNVQDGALVVLDNASGEVRAWVGSSGTLSQAEQVDAVTALRQPGSTLKPFLYAQALAEKRITAASLLEDSSAQIQTSGGLYIPQNYDRHFKGWVSTRTSLGASLNVPAVRTLMMVGPDAFQKQLRRLGLPLQQSGDHYGFSLALGSAEVSLLDLSNAYRTLANGGRSGPTTMLRAAKASPQTAPAPAPTLVAMPSLDARGAFIVSDIMSDPVARARTFGTDSVLATRYWTAVKTGTSKDMRDNWAVGYSQHYTVGVWVGNASGAPMWDVSGTTGAAPIWAAVMNFLHAQQSSQPPKPPPGMVHQRVKFEGNQTEATRDEWFIAGTEQATFATASQDKSALAKVARITSPTNGSIIALDPDIPPQRQRLTLQAQGHKLRWLLDGKPLAQGNQALWMPWPGRHTLQITDAKGKVLDEVKLEVRGAGVKKAAAASAPAP